MYSLFLYINFFITILSTLLGRFIGIKGIMFYSILKFVINIIFSIYLVIEIINNNITIEINIWNWINKITWENEYIIIYNKEIVLMLITVIIISNIVELYSYWYLSHDPFLIRFLSFLQFFSFFMYVLILSHNLILFFIGWEGIGIFSYFLINFWYTRINSNKSAIKAILYNKIGDVLILVIIIMCYMNYNILNMNNLFQLIWEKNKYLIIILILSGWVKSAQIIYKSWLVSSMEGPTPVSSLLHAATMVTAGFFLLFKFSFFISSFFYSYYSYTFPNQFNSIVLINKETEIDSIQISAFRHSSPQSGWGIAGTGPAEGVNIKGSINEIVGNWEYDLIIKIMYYFYIIMLISIFVSNLSSLVQNDVKKLIAYSTAAQIGYMFLSLENLNIGFYHLIIHAFFKSLIFLLAGIYIHSSPLFFNQDFRKFGSFIYFQPLPFILSLFSILTLISFPFFSSFYSKELILNNLFISSTIYGKISYYLIMIINIFTVLYGLKLLLLIFYSTFNINKFYYSILPSIVPSNFLFSILIILLVFSLFIGFYLERYFEILYSSFTGVDYIFINYIPVLSLTIQSAFGGVNQWNLWQPLLKEYDLWSGFSKIYILNYKNIIMIITFLILLFFFLSQKPNRLFFISNNNLNWQFNSLKKNFKLQSSIQSKDLGENQSEINNKVPTESGLVVKGESKLEKGHFFKMDSSIFFYLFLFYKNLVQIFYKNLYYDWFVKKLLIDPYMFISLKIWKNVDRGFLEYLNITIYRKIKKWSLMPIQTFLSLPTSSIPFYKKTNIMSTSLSTNLQNLNNVSLEVPTGIESAEKDKEYNWEDINNTHKNTNISKDIIYKKYNNYILFFGLSLILIVLFF